MKAVGYFHTFRRDTAVLISSVGVVGSTCVRMRALRGIDSAACVVFDDEKRALILQRGPMAPWHPLEWNLPGGMVEDWENEEQAAVRETHEETGLAPRRCRSLIEIEYEPNRWCSFWVAQIDDCDGGLQINWESCAFAWIHQSEMYVYTFVPSVFEALEAGFAYLRGVENVSPLAYHRHAAAAATSPMTGTSIGSPVRPFDDGPSDSVLQLQAQFPSFDEEVLERVLATAGGSMMRAVSVLTTMRDEARSPPRARR